MSYSCLPVQTSSESLQQLQSENAELQRYLTAQRVVIASLERRVGRSLESLGVHLKHVASAISDQVEWQNHLGSVQGEVDRLCDLIADTLLLQKLEAGRVEVCLQPLDLHTLMTTVSRHLLNPGNGRVVRLICEVDPGLPFAFADQELTEAVLTDLLARGLKYSASDSPVVLEAESADNSIYLRVTAQQFAPPGNRDFATEIVLCCRRVEVQKGQISCQHRSDGLQTVTIVLPVLS